MPELPEVETVRRALERHVTGRTVRTVWLFGLALRKPVPLVLCRAARPGRTILGVRRHGKFLLVDFDGGARIVAHLGMTGHFRFHAFRSRLAPSHSWRTPMPCCASSMDRRCRTRTRGGSACSTGPEPGVSDASRPGPDGRGLDPMVERLDGPRLAALFARCRGPIKHLLLDQKRIAGIGNIYASEALFRAGIGPRRLAHTLAPLSASGWPLRFTRSWTRRSRGGGRRCRISAISMSAPGSYGESLLVYDREGEPCLTCGAAIRRIVQTGRSTFYLRDLPEEGERRWGFASEGQAAAR